MKKSFTLGAIALTLLLGACSLTETKFLDAVKGQEVFAEAAATTKVGNFSSDGKTLTVNLGTGDNVFTFVEVVNETEATYKNNVDGQFPIKLDGKKFTADGFTGYFK